MSIVTVALPGRFSVGLCATLTRMGAGLVVAAVLDTVGINVEPHIAIVTGNRPL